MRGSSSGKSLEGIPTTSTRSPLREKACQVALERGAAEKAIQSASLGRGALGAGGASVSGAKFLVLISREELVLGMERRSLACQGSVSKEEKDYSL